MAARELQMPASRDYGIIRRLMNGIPKNDRIIRVFQQLHFHLFRVCLFVWPPADSR